MSVANPTQPPQPVQNPLTAIFTLTQAAQQDPEALAKGLSNLSSLQQAKDVLHFARILLLDNNTKVAVITTFDGDFATYMQDFFDIPAIATAFNDFLPFIEGGAACTPVDKNGDKLLAFILQNNNPPSDPSDPMTLKLPPIWFSAYPTKTVAEINAAPDEGAASA